MDLIKYDELRKKLEKKSFEGKNESLSKWLYYFSFFGNVGSIFFAMFFVYPILEHAISFNLIHGSSSKIIAIITSVIILGIFEFLKRKVLTNLSFDLIKNKFNIFKSFGVFIFSAILIVFSFYFSLNGAKEFVSTNKKYNQQVVVQEKSNIDSIKLVYDEKKQTYINEISNLREINNQLRLNLANTPVTYRTVRNDYQKNIDINQDLINQNQQEIKFLYNELNDVIENEKNRSNILVAENKTINNRNILLFILISSFIELIIITGISFKEYYDMFVYNLNKDKLEPIYIKRKRYTILINFLYKDGFNKIGNQIPGVSTLKDLIKSKTNISNSNKFVDEFIVDMERMGIIKLSGRKRLINTSYETAIELINKFDDELRILKDLN